MVESALNAFKDKHPDYSPEQAKAFLEKLAVNLKKNIQNNKNDFIKK